MKKLLALAPFNKLENILDLTFTLAVKHGDKLVESILGVLEAKRDELSARAALHRANAVAPVPVVAATSLPITLPSSPTPGDGDFYSCPDRDAEAFCEDILDPRKVGCPTHGKKKYEPCPEDSEAPAESSPDLDFIPPIVPFKITPDVPVVSDQQALHSEVA